MAHLSSYGCQSSAVSMNCLVSPSRRALRPYPRSSLYKLCLVVTSPAVHLTCLSQCRSAHHYSGMANSSVYRPVTASQSIGTTLLQNNFLCIWFPPIHTRQSLFAVLTRLYMPPWYESSSGYFDSLVSTNPSDPCWDLSL